MIDGFNKSYISLIETRLENIFKSEDYTRATEAIFYELEQKLTSTIGNIDSDSKDILIDDLKTAIFSQTYHQNKLIYREAFSDALTFFVEVFIIRKG